MASNITYTLKALTEAEMAEYFHVPAASYPPEDRRALVGQVIRDPKLLRAGDRVILRLTVGIYATDPRVYEVMCPPLGDMSLPAKEIDSGRKAAITRYWFENGGVTLLSISREEPAAPVVERDPKPDEALVTAGEIISWRLPVPSYAVRTVPSYAVRITGMGVGEPPPMATKPKCTPECTPASPCRTAEVCPALREDAIAERMRGHNANAGVVRVLSKQEAAEWRSLRYEPSPNGLGSMVGRYRWEDRRR